MGIFLLKVVLVMVGVQVSLAYNKLLGLNVQAEYQQVNIILIELKLSRTTMYTSAIQLIRHALYHIRHFTETASNFLMKVTTSMLFLMMEPVDIPSIEK